MVKLGKAVQRALINKGKAGQVQKVRLGFDELQAKLEARPELLDALNIVVDDETLTSLLLEQKVTRKITVTRYTNFPLNLKKRMTKLGGVQFQDPKVMMLVQRRDIKNIPRLFQAQTTYENSSKVIGADEETWSESNKTRVKALNNVCQNVVVDQDTGELDFTHCVFGLVTGNGKKVDDAREATHVIFYYVREVRALSTALLAAAAAGNLTITNNWSWEAATLTDGDEINVPIYKKYFAGTAFDADAVHMNYENDLAEAIEQEEAAKAAAVAQGQPARKRIRRHSQALGASSSSSSNANVVAKKNVRGKLFGARRCKVKKTPPKD
jgi:hypothetical protein